MNPQWNYSFHPRSPYGVGKYLVIDNKNYRESYNIHASNGICSIMNPLEEGNICNKKNYTSSCKNKNGSKINYI